MIHSLARRLCRRLVPAGSQRWYLTQDVLSTLPRTRGGPCLQSRFYEATLPQCGPGLQLFGSVQLHRPERIRIGARVILAHGVHITGHDTVTLGDDVSVGPYTVINSGDHRHTDPGRPINRQGHVTGPITIADDVWIGAHCVVLRGVSIASGVVVAAMSVVRDDLPGDVLAAGIPAQVKRSREIGARTPTASHSER
jgi:acetyltransferase-like isoleucine patch superfamily enzyme